MRVRAEDVAVPAAGGQVRYVPGWSHDTGLPPGRADIVVAVQALHWMDPGPTFAEITRLLRAGGVFAAMDCDWPPSVGSVVADEAWERCRGTISVYESRLAAGMAGADLCAPLAHDPSLPEHFARDPNKGRTMAVGVKAWSKDEHFSRMRASGQFRWCREVCALATQLGDAERFIALLRSQGDLQTLLKHGLTEQQLGVDAFSAEVRRELGAATRPFWFTYRVRLGFV
jgi:SAM-dependent methyltransferase